MCHGACCAFGLFDELSASGASHGTVYVEHVCFDTSSTKPKVLPITSVDVLLDQCDAAVSVRD